VAGGEGADEDGPVVVEADGLAVRAAVFEVAVEDAVFVVEEFGSVGLHMGNIIYCY
jgi:hypothetical protein